MGHPGRIEARIAQLSQRQFGHVTREQLLGIEIGMSERTISGWIARGRLIVVHAGVYAVSYRRTEPIAQAAAARLACGTEAVLSHDTAAALWGLVRKWPGCPEIAGPRDRRRPGIRYHHIQTLTRRDIRRHRGLRVTSPARTLNDIRRRLTTRQFRRAVDDARLAGLLTRTAALQFTADARPSRSDWELDFPAFARRFGLPVPQMNARVAGYEVDALFVEERVIVELDSWEHHQGHGSFEGDRDRDSDTLAADYVTVRITWERYTDRPEAEAERLAHILQRRRQRRLDREGQARRDG